MKTSETPGFLKVASIQMVSTPDIQENLASAQRLVNAAARAEAKVVVLPEYFCLMGLKDTDKVAAKEVVGKGPIQERLAAIAQENRIYLIAGTIPLEAPQSDKVLNTTLVYDPFGQAIARYDKMHLFGFQTDSEHFEESKTITPGNEVGTLHIQENNTEWRFGLSICYDLRFPELYRAMGEVDCHCIPAAFTYTTGQVHWEILLRARAIENQCYVLASAQGGAHLNQRRTWGNSMIIDPWGLIMSQLPEDEGFITATLSKEKINEVRSQLPALKHRTL